MEWIKLEISSEIAARHGIPGGFRGWGLVDSSGDVVGTIVQEGARFSGVVGGCMVPAQRTLRDAKRYVRLIVTGNTGEG